MLNFNEQFTRCEECNYTVMRWGINTDNMKNLFLIFICFPLFAKAQENINVQGTSGNLYIDHVSAPKENFYSVGRLYNISPKEIAPFNNLTLDNGITIGQVIKIPLISENFLQEGSAAPDEAAVPVFHRVLGKETLYQLKTRYNNVPVASLKLWNKLAGNSLTPGQNIIVGFLKVKKEVSALAQKGIEIPADDNTGKIKEATVKQNAFPPKAVNEITDPVKTVDPNNTPSAMSGITGKDFKGGVFKSMYRNTGKEEAGMAGVFKTTSGWEDGKFYCLHNAAPQGSVVKITNTATGKSVYAKVLDVMPDLKQNNDLNIRLSNAAADALGAGMNNFNCTINY